MNWIQRLRSYSEEFSTEISSQWRGASEERIAYFSALCKQSLPEDYLSFLRAMGEEDGGLLEFFPAITRIEYLIEYYEECLRLEPESIPQDMIVFAIGQVGLDQVSIDMRPHGNCNIMLTSDDEIDGLYSENLRKMLFQFAFLKLEPKRYQYVQRMSSSERSISSTLKSKNLPLMRYLEQLLPTFGLKKLDFSDVMHYCARKNGLSLYLRHSEQKRIFFEICADSETEGRALARLLQKEFSSVPV